MKLKIAIIGSGFGQYGLLPAFRAVKNCEVVAICGEKRPQLIQYCEKIGFKNIYSDWQILLEKEKLDAVALAVTPRAQYEIAKAAIKKGLHVFAEKPLARNAREARELLSLAQKKKVTHAVDFMFPEIPEWEKAKKLLDKKALGALKHVSVNWDFLSYDVKNKIKGWKTDVSEGGGALSFYFSHGLYYLEYFAGKITEARAELTHSKESLNGAEVAADITLRFKGGITGLAHVCCNSREPTRHQVIFQCEKGDIVLENDGKVVDNFILKTLSDGKTKNIAVKKEKGREGEDERVKIVKKLAERFVDSCILGKQMAPSFKDGLRVQVLIEKIRNQSR